MFSFKVSDKEYRVRFGYKVLSETNIIDKVVNLGVQNEDQFSIKSMISIVSELLLVGLQKYHSDEFGYDTESEKQESMKKVYELLDTYEDEGTEENPQDGFTMLENLQGELMENGFLLKMAQNATEKTGTKKLQKTIKK